MWWWCCCSMNRHNPWYVKGDSRERNEKAKKAYTALLTVTARTPNNQAYTNFSTEVPTFFPSMIVTWTVMFEYSEVWHARVKSKTTLYFLSTSIILLVNISLYNATIYLCLMTFPHLRTKKEALEFLSCSLYLRQFKMWPRGLNLGQGIL